MFEKLAHLLARWYAKLKIRHVGMLSWNSGTPYGMLASLLARKPRWYASMSARRPRSHAGTHGTEFSKLATDVSIVYSKNSHIWYSNSSLLKSDKFLKKRDLKNLTLLYVGCFFTLYKDVWWSKDVWWKNAWQSIKVCNIRVLCKGAWLNYASILRYGRRVEKHTILRYGTRIEKHT